jgi:hypothetical protein
MLAFRAADTACCQNPYGLSEETTQSEDFETQTPQAHEGESPQEALALQDVSALCVLIVR